MKTKINQDVLYKIIAIAVYVLIAVLLRFYFAILKPSFLAPIENTLVYAILTGIGPLIGALFVIYVFKRDIIYSTFGQSKGKSIISALIPVVLFFLYDFFTGQYLFPNTLIVITCLIYSYFEEYGWRGYLQSELIELPAGRRVTIITLIWFMWHLNFSMNQSNAFFLIILFFGSWGIGQVAIKSKSIIACACFHAVINIVSNMQMDLFKIIIISICIISWFYIWYSKRFSSKLIN